MSKRFLLVLAIILLLPLSVYAVSVDTAVYRSTLTAQNTGTALTNLGIPFNIAGQSLIDADFITSGQLNAVLHDSSGNDVPHMPSSTIQVMKGAVLDEQSVFTTQTTEANNDTTNDVTFLGGAPVVNDAYYFGMDLPGRMLTVNVSQAGAGTWTHTWEYWTGSSWASLSNVSDGTSNFKINGILPVTFTRPILWPTTSVNGITAFWVRARLSAFTSMSIQPKGKRVQWQTAQWWVYEDSIANNQVIQYTLSLMPIDSVTYYPLFIGGSGITTPDNASIEPGDTYHVQVIGKLSFTNTGTTFCIVCKGSVFQLYPSASGTITLAVTGSGGTTLSLSGLTIPGSGSQTIDVSSNGTFLFLSATGFGTGTATTSGTARTITNNASDWTFGVSGSTVFFDSVAIAKAATVSSLTDSQANWLTWTLVNTAADVGGFLRLALQ